MKKRTFILILITTIFFYTSIFFKNIIFDIFEENSQKKEQYLIKIKFNCQQIMFETLGDLEILYNKNTNLTKNEKEDSEKKFNKLISSYHGLINSKTRYDLSKNFNSFFYHAELLEYFLNKDLTYLQINEKYQNIISIFYDELEFVNENKIK